ncbi:MAG: hypothetical protein ACHQUC_04215 [Chlamydiales bacterium]
MKFFALIFTVLFPFVAFASFKLSDFEGNYTTYSSSAGGITVPNFQNQSETTIAQLTIGKHGKGNVNFVSSVTYSPPHTLTPTQLFNLPLTLTITDPVHGIARLVVESFPDTQSTTEYDVIATKSPSRHGGCADRVTSMLFNVTGVTSSNPPVIIHNTRLVVVHRQPG